MGQGIDNYFSVSANIVEFVNEAASASQKRNGMDLGQREKNGERDCE